MMSNGPYVKPTTAAYVVPTKAITSSTMTLPRKRRKRQCWKRFHFVSGAMVIGALKSSLGVDTRRRG